MLLEQKACLCFVLIFLFLREFILHVCCDVDDASNSRLTRSIVEFSGTSQEVLRAELGKTLGSEPVSLMIKKDRSVVKLRGTRGNGVSLPLFEGECHAPSSDSRDETEPQWTLWNTEKPTSCTGLSSAQKQNSPASGAPWPRYGLRPQTPIIGSRSHASHSVPLSPILQFYHGHRWRRFVHVEGKDDADRVKQC